MAVPGIATGRYSDGLIFADYLASFMGIDSPLPYTQWINLSKRRVTHGMNFAHGGTVYNKSDLDESIAVVSNAGNDYTQYYAVDLGTHKGYRVFAAKVIDQLELNLREIRKIGVKKVARSVSYEKCDKPLNNDTIFHNTLLQKMVQKLNTETTDSPFHILDLYGTFMSVINKQGGADYSGIDKIGSAPLFKPCCTPTAPKALCGSVYANGVKLYTLCDNPKDSLFWDLYHPTQSGWQEISSAMKPSFDELMQCNI
ncbi:hypothetical protein MKX01_008019 [Papaver californicum]|nr:hypothetical protein MKX01_008019 [Papaver californicum]